MLKNHIIVKKKKKKRLQYKIEISSEPRTTMPPVLET